MAVTVTVCGSGSSVIPVASAQPPPSVLSLPVQVTNTAGDWMYALVTWRQPAAGAGVTVSVGDDVHNFWEPLVQPNGTSAATGVVRSAIWYAPAAKAAQWVTIAPSGIYASLAATILDADGLLPWVTLACRGRGHANAATSLAVTTGTPPAQALVLAAFGSDLLSDTASLAGGWTLLPPVTCSNGTDTTSDLTLTAGWQVATVPVTGTLTVSPAAADLCGSIAGALVSAAAPAQPSPGWPVTITEIAPGAGPATPPDEITWVSLSPRSLAVTLTQGRQYNLGALAAGAGVLTLDNPDGAVMPPGSGAYAGIDSGTPYRIRQVWQGGAWQAQFSGNGTSSSPQVQGPTFSTGITPGQPYTVSAWLAPSVPWPSGLVMSLRFFAGSTLLATFPSAPVTGTVPQLATASGTAPAGTTKAVVFITASGTPPASAVFSAAAGPAGGGYLTIPAATAWAAQNGAAATILAPWQADPRGAPVITPYSVPYAGFFQKWPRQWDTDIYRGVTAATITDAWGYCQAQLQPVLQAEIGNDAPYASWPCTDAPGSRYAANSAPGNPLPLAVSLSKYGSGGAQASFGQNSDALLGAQGTVELTSSVRAQSQAGMWGLSGVSGLISSPPYGYSLACTDSGFPSPANGMSIEFWFQAAAPFNPVPGTQSLLFSLSGLPASPLSFPPGIQVWMQTQLFLTTAFGVTPSQVMISNVNYATGTPPVTHVVITTTTTTWTAWIDGVKTASGTWATPLPAQLPHLCLNGPMGLPYFSQGFGGFATCYNGTTGHAAIYPQILTPERITTHYQAGVAGMAGDTVQYRIERLLQAGGALGRRVIIPDTAAAVTTAASCQDIASQPAATSVQNIAGSTPPGNVLVSPPGDIVYYSRSSRWNQPATWVLGDAPWLGEIPCQPGTSMSWDPLRVVDDIQLTQLDNLDIVTPSGAAAALEPAAQAQYGDQTYWQTGYLQGDITQPPSFGPGLPDVANWIAATSAQPLTRLDAVTVDAAANPAAWQFVTQAAAGDMITVNIRPPTSTEVISVTGRISQTQRATQYSQDKTAGTITVLIDAAPEASVLTADDPVRGQLTGANRLAW